RHSVRPGLTGLAQVNGRNFLSWEERFKFDVFYVENISFMLDMKIIFRTFFKVAKSSDMGVRGVDYAENSLDIIRSKEKEDSQQ
ncbi:MAG: sugar transferase, partial [Bacteroidales bacterium]